MLKPTVYEIILFGLIIVKLKKIIKIYYAQKRLKQWIVKANAWYNTSGREVVLWQTL